MELVVERAIQAGLVATFVITLLIYTGRAMGLYLDFPQMLGLLFVTPRYAATVYTVGLLAHFTIGALVALIYAWAFQSLGVPATWVWGGIFGLIHGFLAGVFLRIVSVIHPQIGPEKPLPPPGFFCKNYGNLIPLKLAFVHIVFGVTVGLLYTPGF